MKKKDKKIIKLSSAKIKAEKRRQEKEKMTPEQKRKRYISIAIQIAIGVILAFILMQITVSSFNKTIGFDSSKTAVDNLFTGIDTCDNDTIKKSLYLHSKSYNTNAENMYQFAENNKDRLKLHFDSKNNKFTETDANVDDAKKATSIDKITAAKTTELTYDSTITIDDHKYQTISVYNVKTCQIDNRWFVYDMQSIITEIKSIEKPWVNDSVQKYGKDSLGYLYLDENWSEYSQQNNTLMEGFDDHMSFLSSDSIIFTGKINTKISIPEFIEKIKSDLKSKKCIQINEFNTKLDGMNCKEIVAYNKENQMHYYLWVYKTPLIDDALYCMELYTKNPFESYPVVQTYSR